MCLIINKFCTKYKHSVFITKLNYKKMYLLKGLRYKVCVLLKNMILLSRKQCN